MNRSTVLVTIIIVVSLIYAIPVPVAGQNNSENNLDIFKESLPWVPGLAEDYSVSGPEIDWILELESEEETEETTAAPSVFSEPPQQDKELFSFGLKELLELDIDTGLVTQENLEETEELEFELPQEIDTAPAEAPPQEEAEEKADGWGPFFRDEGIFHTELPGKSELNVSGRKFIKFDMKNTDYINDPERSSSSDITVEQQLQVKVRGSVFDERLTIEIDYDDSRPEVDRQKTRVYYDGNEYDLGFADFKANAEFGDIRLSLPGTNFVSYNKQVFGLSANARLSNIDLGFWGLDEMRFYAITSQQKGQTKRKTFEGSNQRRIPEPIGDIYPIRRTYYRPLVDTGALPVKVNSEVIYLDNQNSEDNDANTLEEFTVANDTDTYEGDFDKLEPGEDYTMDYQTGVIRFRRSINRDYVIAVELKYDGGELGANTPFMIKDENESSRYDDYHLLNRYQLASRNIIRDDPDRVLHIRDSAGNERPSNTQAKYVDLLGLDNDGDDQIDDKHIDFELGVLTFPETQPFVNNNLPETNRTVYGSPAEREQIYEIYQELMVRESSYMLGFNVVRNSEKVTVDGEVLERDRDYSIDYQSGFLMFFDRVEIDEDSEIEVTYETMGIGQTRDETFLGGRVEADVSDNISVGMTALSNQESEESSLPRLGEEAKSTLVREYDIDWRPLHSFQDIMADLFGYTYFEDHPMDKQLKVDLKGEWAKSTRDPNLAGSLVVDDFYGLDQQIPFGRGEFDWTVADAPLQFPGGDTVLDGRSIPEFDDVDEAGHEPDPDDEEDQSSLRVKFPMGSAEYENPAGLDTSDSKYWGAVQYQFSRSGEDLRGYQYVELWVKWEDDAAGGTLSLDIGRLPEDSDRSATLNTEDKNGNDVLGPGEDNGFKTHDFVFGADNGLLDSEDLNRNGRPDQLENYIHFSNINHSDTYFGDTTSHGWTLYRLPLADWAGEIKTDGSDIPEYSDVLQAARTVRLVYESPDGPGSGGKSFLLEKMGVVRTSWKSDADQDRFSLKNVTSAEDNRLPPPDSSKFRSDSTRPRAKALALVSKDGIDSSVARAYLNLPSAEQFSNHNYLKFYLHRKDSKFPETFYARFGTDRNNYFEYRIDMDHPAANNWVTDKGRGWYLVSLDIQAFEDDLIEKTMSDSDSIRRGNRFIMGDPSLFDIGRYEFLLDGANDEDEVLVTYLYLDGSQEESGQASLLKADVDIYNGFLKLKGSDRELEGDFRTIGLVNSSTADRFVARDEQSRNLSGSIELNRLIPANWGLGVPFSFNWSDQTTEMDPDRIERVKNENLGKVVDEKTSFRTGLNTPELYPDFTFNWKKNSGDVDQKKRKRKWASEDSEWTLGANYSRTFKNAIFGYIPVGNSISLQANASLRKMEETKTSLGEVDVSERDREEEGRSASLKLGFVPFDWITLRPDFSYSDLDRTTLDYSGLISRSHSIGLRVKPSGFYGFDPSFDFSLKTSENFRPLEENKSVSLNGKSSMSLQTTPQKWWSGLSFMTLRYNFSLSGDGNYENLDENTSVSKVYEDLFSDFSWLWKGPQLDVSADDLSIDRNSASKSESHQFRGELDLWSPLQTRYNINFSQTNSQSNNSVSSRNTKSYNLDNRLSLDSVIGWFERNTDNSSLNVKYTLRTSESGSKESIDHSINKTWNTRWSERWSTNFRWNTTLGKTTDDVSTKERYKYAPSLDFRWLVNKPDEEGVLWFNNRLEISGGLSAVFNEQTENGETKEDNYSYSGNFGGAYNITDQIKVRFSGNFSIYRDNYRDANDKNIYGLMASVDFRF